MQIVLDKSQLENSIKYTVAMQHFQRITLQAAFL